jgi:hypothetical protein
MGYYINYEIEILGDIIWDELVVHTKLYSYNCKWMYLSDMNNNIIIFSLYSTHEIIDVIYILKELYGFDVRYRRYIINDEWKN